MNEQFWDILGVVLSVIFFFIGYWIGRKEGRVTNWQSQVLEEQRTLQVSIMELELQEKLGAIGRGLRRLDEGDDACVPTVLHDSMAGLAVYGIAEKHLSESEHLREKFRDEVRAALEKLLELEPEKGEILARRLVEKINELNSPSTIKLSTELRDLLKETKSKFRQIPDRQEAYKIIEAALAKAEPEKRVSSVAPPLREITGPKF